MSFEFSNPLDGLAQRDTLAAHGQRVFEEFARCIESVQWIDEYQREEIELQPRKLYHALRLQGRVILGLPWHERSDRGLEAEAENAACNFTAWLQRQEDGYARFESMLQWHPRALLILHGVLDTFSDAIEALATTATEELRELRASVGRSNLDWNTPTPRTRRRIEGLLYLKIISE